MFEFIEKLRQKSPETKWRIAMGTSGLVAGAIFIIWAISLSSTISKAGEISTPASTTSSFSELGDAFSTTWSRGQTLFTFFQTATTTPPENPAAVATSTVVATSSAQTPPVQVATTTASSTPKKTVPRINNDGVEEVSI